MSLHAVVAGWLLGPPSGANRRLGSLLAELPAQLGDDERVTVLHRPDYSGERFGEPRIAWQAIDVPAGPTLRRVARERQLLPDALTRLGATVHDHALLPAPPVAVPLCLTVHDLRAADGLTRWPRTLARAVLRRSCRRARAVIVPSEWTGSRLRELAPDAPEPIVIGNAVTVRDGPSPRALPAAGYVLHVGHLEPRKNLTVLVRALARLGAHAPELWLVGRDAGCGRRLDALARRLHVRLRRLGTVDEAELQGLYRHAHVVAMPSRYEGFGLPALEGLAHGRPLLAADATALPEVAGAHAVLLPPDDVDAWAGALGGPLGDDPASRERRRAFATRGTWRDLASRLLDVWRRC